ncbi:MAG: hypothetical protein ACI9UR_002653 [Bacteroidia bacterium]|jgi:hypothetical protein
MLVHSGSVWLKPNLNHHDFARLTRQNPIFPEMIEFDENKCRTTKINQALALCLSIDKDWSEIKNGTLSEKLEVPR